MKYLSVKQYADAHGLPDRTVRNWGKINEYLRDICLTAQNQYKALLDYFKVKY